MYLLCVTCLYFFYAISVCTHVDPRCPGDQVYSDCASSCGVRCGDRDLPSRCDDICREGCTCPPGLLLRTSNPLDPTDRFESRCVLPEECPPGTCN